MPKKKKKLRLDNYWICYQCALDRGGKWPRGHMATVITGTCTYCDGKNQNSTFIIPYVDFNWPGIELEIDVTEYRD